MSELHEFTITRASATFLRNEVKEMLKHCDIDENTFASLVNLCEALREADRIEITIVPQY